MIIKQARKPLLAVVLLLVLTASAAAGDGQVRIAPWYRNLDASVSLRFDDGLESHAVKVIPLLNRYGFRATFLVNPGSKQYRAHRDFWEKTVPSLGHHLGNHTMNHRGARTIEEADYEIGETSRIIWRVQPRESKLLVFASGGGKKLWGGKEWEQADPAYRQLVQKYHLIDLYDGNHPYLSVRSGMGTKDLCGALDSTLARGGHQSYAFHDIGKSSFLERVKMLFRGYGMTISEETFAGFLSCLDERRKRIWVSPLDDILKYEEEVRDATVQTTRSDRHADTLQLSVSTDPALYDQPITLILPYRQGRTVQSVRQEQEQCAVYQDGAGHVLVDVRPVNSTVTITYDGA